MQGSSTCIYTMSDIGGNNINTIEDFINDAYDTWNIPPLAFLILADYGATGNGILSPIWDYYCASDHIYGDVNGNGLAQINGSVIAGKDNAVIVSHRIPVLFPEPIRRSDRAGSGVQFFGL